MEDGGSELERRTETLLWKACTEEIRLQVERFTSLDSKAGILIGFVVAALAEILAALIVVAAEHPARLAGLSSSAAVVAFVIGIAAISLAALFATLVLWPRRFVGCEFRAIHRRVEEAKSQEAIEKEVMGFEAGYLAEAALLAAWSLNEASICRKVRWVRPLSMTVGVAVISLSVAVVLIVFEGIRNPVIEDRARVKGEAAHVADSGAVGTVTPSTDHTARPQSPTSRILVPSPSVGSKKSINPKLTNTSGVGH